MKKYMLAAIIATAAFLAGSIATTIPIVSADGSTNSNNAWAKLVARVLALEAQTKLVTLQDGENGWNPDGATETFKIKDASVNSKSIVHAITDLGTGGYPCHLFPEDDGDSNLMCEYAGSIISPPDGATLTYVIHNAP